MISKRPGIGSASERPPSGGGGVTRTATEQQVLDVLTGYFSNTFVIDHGDEMPAYMASEVLELLQRECGL